MPQSARSRLPAALLLALGLGLAGCATVSSLNTAARTLDAYALNPLPPQPGAGGGTRLLFVAEPVDT